MKCVRCDAEIVDTTHPCPQCGIELTAADILMMRRNVPEKEGPKLAVQLDLHADFKAAIARHLDLPEWP